MSIQNILDRSRAEVVTISPTDSLKKAADLMRAYNIAALVVKSGAAITGLISDREIVHAVWRHGERALHMAVLEIVTHPTITIAPEDNPEARHEPDDALPRPAFARDRKWKAGRHRQHR